MAVQVTDVNQVVSACNRIIEIMDGEMSTVLRKVGAAKNNCTKKELAINGKSFEGYFEDLYNELNNTINGTKDVMVAIKNVAQYAHDKEAAEREAELAEENK